MAEDDYVPISSSVSSADILAFRQDCCQQTDGVGLRVGKKAEFTLIAPLTADGAAKFRERAAKIQADQ